MLYLPPSRDHRNRLASLSSLVLVFALPIAIHAQGSGRSSVGTGGKHVVQGYIFFPSGRRAEGPIQVKLQSHLAGEISVTADSSGSFTFSNLAPGNYTVVVEAGENYEIAREDVFVDSDLNLSRMGIPTASTSRRYSLMIHLQPKVSSRDRTKPAVLNAALAGVPENARRLYQTGSDLARAGNSVKAVDNFKQAVALYPNFQLALNELGIQYLKLGNAEKAIDVLNRAVKLEPDTFTPRLNLGIALLEAKQFHEAQTHLTEALRHNASAPTGHMYLGLALVHLDSYDAAEKELLRSVELGGDGFSLAHYYLGGLYWKRRDYARAVEHLEKYLQLTPNAPDAERVRTTNKELRNRL